MDRDGNNPAAGAFENFVSRTGADFVVEYQAPSAENNCTWYRLYASGWIEQGGMASVPNGNSNAGYMLLKSVESYLGE